MDDFTHNVPLFCGGQKTFEQCWYASYTMLFRYHRRNPTQIKDRLNGVGIDVADALANGLDDRDYKRVADSLGTKKWSGAPFKAGGGFWDFGLSDGAEAFIEQLQISPLWVSRYIKKGSYHITLAVGIEDTDETRIVYNNPFPGPRDAIEMTMPANLYVRDITDAMGSVQAFR